MKYENLIAKHNTITRNTAQLRREEDPENAPKCLIGPSYSLDNCPFICKVLYMKTSIQLRNKRHSFYSRVLQFKNWRLTVLLDYKSNF